MRIYIDDIYFLFFINHVSYYGNRFIIFVFDYAAAYNYYFLCNYFYHLYFIKIWNLIKIWIDSGLCKYFMGYINTICNFVYCAQKNRASITLQSYNANFTVVQQTHLDQMAFRQMAFRQIALHQIPAFEMNRRALCVLPRP